MPRAWLDAWLGPIAAWRYVDAAGSVGRINRASEMPTVATPILPLGAYAVQARIPQINRLLNAWRDIGALPQDAAQLADEQLHQAAQHGLTLNEDCFIFAMNGLTMPAQWVKHPAVKTAIQRAAQAECTLAEALSQLDMQTQQEIESA